MWPSTFFFLLSQNPASQHHEYLVLVSCLPHLLRLFFVISRLRPAPPHPTPSACTHHTPHGTHMYSFHAAARDPPVATTGKRVVHVGDPFRTSCLHEALAPNIYIYLYNETREKSQDQCFCLGSMLLPTWHSTKRVRIGQTAPSFDEISEDADGDLHVCSCLTPPLSPTPLCAHVKQYNVITTLPGTLSAPRHEWYETTCIYIYAPCRFDRSLSLHSASFKVNDLLSFTVWCQKCCRNPKTGASAYLLPIWTDRLANSPALKALYAPRYLHSAPQRMCATPPFPFHNCYCNADTRKKSRTF